MASCLAQACLYDSRWGQSTAEQKHTAARLAPASVTARAGEDEVAHRSATIRACATRAYAAETLDFEQRFDELIRQANSVLEPAIGLTLRSAGTTPWEPPNGERDLSSAIDDLPSCAGPTTDWVVGLLQSTAGVVTDFHVLGKGRMYSPYLVLRAANDPAELDALTRALPDLDQATRDKLYSERKRHKALAVFLHELGHTLGAIHRSAKDTLMSPVYDASETGYDEPTLVLLRNGLVARLDEVPTYGESRRYLESHAGGFLESERAGQIEMLADWEKRRPRASPASNGTAPAVAASAAPPPRVTPVPFESLPKRDRQTFDDASRLEHESARRAWLVAQPLFEAYPAVREVQELRCRLAKARRFYPAVTDAHCVRLAAIDADSADAGG